MQQIPIVDTDGRLVGLHLLQEILGTVERPNWAVVMAGGRGERLRPVTNALPKPMVRVAGRPILERIVLHLEASGVLREAIDAFGAHIASETLVERLSVGHGAPFAGLHRDELVLDGEPLAIRIDRIAADA